MSYIRADLYPQAGAASHYIDFVFKADPKTTAASLSQYITKLGQLTDPRLRIAIKMPEDMVAAGWLGNLMKDRDMHPCAMRWSHKCYWLLEPTMAPHIYIFYGVFRTIKEAKKFQQERWILTSLISKKHRPVFFINNANTKEIDTWQI